MARIHVWLNDKLLTITDTEAKEAGVTRSSFVREAVIEKIFGDKGVGIKTPAKEQQPHGKP